MMEQKCIKYLMKTFGNVHHSGLTYLAKVVDKYELGEDILDVYKIVAEEEGTTPAAIERAIRYYTNTWYSRVGAADLAEEFNYSLNPGQTKFVVAELIPLLKIYLEEQD